MKSALLILAIWSNSPDGQTRDLVALPLPPRACLALQSALWAIPFETVARDEMGDLPAIDGACIPDDGSRAQ